MPVPHKRPALALALVLSWCVAACGPSGDEERSPRPSGALGPVTREAAAEALRGLCDLRSVTALGEAEALFLDRSHAMLHVIAAATEVRNRGAAADLLEAKQRVESGLAGAELPPDFAADVGALIETTRAALEAIGVEVPPCPI